MIKTDAGEKRHNRTEDIGRVIGCAEPGLHQYIIHRMHVAEVDEHHHRNNLKFCGIA